MLGEIAAISRQSGINAMGGSVLASAAHVSSGMSEFRAAAVKVPGPNWDGVAGEAQIERCRRMVYALTHINTYIMREEHTNCHLGAYAPTRIPLAY